MTNAERIRIRQRAVAFFRDHCARFPHHPTDSEVQQYADVSVAIAECEERLTNLNVARETLLDNAAR